MLPTLLVLVQVEPWQAQGLIRGWRLLWRVLSDKSKDIASEKIKKLIDTEKTFLPMNFKIWRPVSELVAFFAVLSLSVQQDALA